MKPKPALQDGNTGLCRSSSSDRRTSNGVVHSNEINPPPTTTATTTQNKPQEGQAIWEISCSVGCFLSQPESPAEQGCIMDMDRGYRSYSGIKAFGAMSTVDCCWVTL
ncbi:unnamed protein product [Arctogadus glacialis]